jgi:hypothetical protein
MQAFLARITVEQVWWIGWAFAVAALVVAAMATRAITRSREQRRINLVTGIQRAVSDVAALQTAGWPAELHRLPDGRLCISVRLGVRETLPIDAFLVLPVDYPLRPPEVTVACGRQPLSLTLPCLQVWTHDSSALTALQEVAAQVPGASRRPRVRLTAEGELLPTR